MISCGPSPSYINWRKIAKTRFHGGQPWKRVGLFSPTEIGFNPAVIGSLKTGRLVGMNLRAPISASAIRSLPSTLRVQWEVS